MTLLRRLLKVQPFLVVIAALLTSCGKGGCDLCVYGDTPSGVAAASAAAGMGLKVTVVPVCESDQGVGDCGACGALDIRGIDDRRQVCGLALKFYRTLGLADGLLESWTVDPGAAGAVFDDWLRAPGITLLSTPSRIDTGRVKAKWYIDCSRRGANITGKAGNVLRIDPDSMEDGQIAAMKVALAIRHGLKSVSEVDNNEIDSLMVSDPYLDGMIPDAVCWESSEDNKYSVVTPAYGRYDLYALIRADSDAGDAVTLSIPRKKKKITLKPCEIEEEPCLSDAGCRCVWHRLLNSTFEKGDTIDVFVAADSRTPATPATSATASAAPVAAILLTPTANYEEERVRPYELEDPLRFADGRKVKSKSDWTARRREILELFQNEMYGRMPEPCEFRLDSLEEGTTAAGYGIRRQTRMWFNEDCTGPHIDWMTILPKDGEGPFPCVLMLNFYGNHCLLPDEEILVPDSWQDNDKKYFVTDHKASEKARGLETGTDSRFQSAVGFLLARGYALVTACYSDVSPDPSGKSLQDSLAFTGVFDLWGPRDPERGDNTGALAAWAWALSRGMDLIEQTPGLDASRILLTGCSRLGKAALLAGAFDERAAVVAPIQTGAGGVPLAKRNFGENVKTETASFTHWFCGNFRKYAARESRQPFDQHLLVSCVAPRSLFAGGFDNPWFDTKGEFLALQAASPVWEFLGKKGLPGVEWPGDFDNSAIGENMAYYRRNNEHGIAMADWVRMLDFADEAFARVR